ncbi:MAG: FkbM family methyltransferase, partial [Deltaproteobacteria bacterium]|nr:FkbM family methyltransferase [Deltaproteobacteria bacterium]
DVYKRQVGQFAQFARKKFKNAKIYCFEPIPQAYAKLKEWAEKDGHSVAYPLALGEENKTVEFFVHSDHSPSSSLLRTTPLKHHYYPFTKKQQAITVQMTKLDDWLSKEQIKLEEEILIKLDVQGYEDRVLRGATRLLQKAKAVIAEVNFDKFYEDQATFWDIAILLRECGYDYVGNWSQSIALDGHVTFIDAVFVRK